MAPANISKRSQLNVFFCQTVFFWVPWIEVIIVFLTPIFSVSRVQNTSATVQWTTLPTNTVAGNGLRKIKKLSFRQKENIYYADPDPIFRLRLFIRFLTWHFTTVGGGGRGMPRPATVVPVGARTVTMAAVSFRYIKVESNLRILVKYFCVYFFC